MSVTSPESGRAEGAAPKLVKSADKLIKDCLAAQHEQIMLVTENRNTLAENHNKKKLATTLLVVETGMIADHFW